MCEILKNSDVFSLKIIAQNRGLFQGFPPENESIFINSILGILTREKFCGAKRVFFGVFVRKKRSFFAFCIDITSPGKIYFILARLASKGGTFYV